MLRRPAGPAHSFKTRYATLLLLTAAVFVASLTGFAWADKQVTVVVDGAARTVRTQCADVASLIEEASISVGGSDLISPPLSSPLADGDAVVVRHAIPVTLRIGADSTQLQVLGRTVGDALVVAGLDPTNGMKTTPALDAPLEPGMVIGVTDVFVRIQETVQQTPFDVVITNDPKLPLGTRKVVRSGAPGRSLRVYRVLVVGGSPAQKTLTAERVVTRPVDELVTYGSKQRIRRVVHEVHRPAPQPPRVGKAFNVCATAYTPWDAGCGGIGEIQYRKRAYNVPDGWGIIAVDTSVIARGSRVYVAGYGYAVACDTGGAIKGRKIDVCFWGDDLYAPAVSAADHDPSVKNAARQATHRWGVRRNVRIVILSKP